MKWKSVIILLLVAIGSFSAFVYHYGFTASDLLSLSFYQDLANPSVRIIKVQEGLRKEEIAKVIGDKLGWDESQKDEFINAHLALSISNMEGYYYPKSYLVQKTQDPLGMSQIMLSQFKKATKDITKTKATKIINEDTAIKIASIIQRESGGKSDMRLISGIIWNRIFKGMKLQMDATLQYAKGNEEEWWPQVVPSDKKINSPYNTYMYTDLPPHPISSPGLAAIAAAYNPIKTSCLFYIHDKKGNIHCSATYEGHKANIAKYY